MLAPSSGGPSTEQSSREIALQSSDRETNQILYNKGAGVAHKNNEIYSVKGTRNNDTFHSGTTVYLFFKFVDFFLIYTNHPTRGAAPSMTSPS